MKTKLQRSRFYILFGLIISGVGFYTHNDMLIMYGAAVTGWCFGMWCNEKNKLMKDEKRSSNNNKL